MPLPLRVLLSASLSVSGIGIIKSEHVCPLLPLPQMCIACKNRAGRMRQNGRMMFVSMSQSRRTFLKAAGALGALGNVATAEERFRKPLGVELYTVRSLLPAHADETLKRIQDI